MVTEGQEYGVNARVISFGDGVQPAQSKWTFFPVVCEVDGAETTYEAVSFVRDKMVAGQSYQLLILHKGDYTHRLNKVVATLPGDGSTAPPVTPQAKPQANPQPQAPQPQAPQPARAFLPPDMASRWREFNTHARTAAMNAKDMARIYADLIIAGRLDKDGEEIVVTKNMVQEWVSEEYQRYWLNHGSYPPQDIHGDMFQNSANQEAN